MSRKTKAVMGRPRIGKNLRVVMPSSVDPSTEDFIESHTSTLGSIGRVIDAMVKHLKTNNIKFY